VLAYLKALKRVFSNFKNKAKKQNSRFVFHVQELRKHLIRIVVFYALASIICLIFSEEIIPFLYNPLHKFHINDSVETLTLNSIGVFEVIMTNFKIAFILGFIISLPLLLFEFWNFVSPGLYKKERKQAKSYLILGLFLFYIGISFGFFFIIPLFFENALSWSSKYTNVMLTFESYFNVLITMTLIFGLIFEVPVILSILCMVGVISSELMSKNRRIAFLTSCILGAILSPPDVLSLFLVSIPIYVMFEFSLLLMKKIERSRDLKPNTPEEASHDSF
jgi:sec-independent protein translocase protein TatC